MAALWGATLAVFVAGCSSISPGLGTVAPTDSVAAASEPSAAELPAATVSRSGNRQGLLGGTELYGYLPYWEMSGSMATYLAGVPLTTLELFSVSAFSTGALNRKAVGYRRITGAIGARIIGEAHARGERVELTFSSFGFDRNAWIFGRDLPPTFDRRRPGPLDEPSPPATVAARRAASELASLFAQLGVDGINLDVERIDSRSRDGYATFIADLRSRIQEVRPDATLSVATMANPAGANLASVAVSAGADRVFLMGYDFHWSGSDPGGSAPIDRLDDGPSLTTAMEAYRAVGVPADRLILGLPLFGMAWPTATADRYSPRIGPGVAWTPTKHQALLADPGLSPHLDPLEVTEYLSQSVAPTTGGGGSPAPPAWRAVFYDSPRSLRAKLQLARGAGYAGAGFWAIGYERGVAGYTELMRDFLAGLVVPVPPVDQPAERLEPCISRC